MRHEYPVAIIDADDLIQSFKADDIWNKFIRHALNTVFVSVRTNDHSKAWSDHFTQAVDRIPEIVEFYRLAGDVDYILKIMVGSMQEYDRVYKNLIAKVSLFDVSAHFAMEKLKFTTELPVRQALKSPQK